MSPELVTMPFQQGHTPWNKEKRMSEETRGRMSESAKKRFANSPHPRKGCTISEEHKEILRRAHTGRKPTQEQIEKRMNSLHETYKRRTSKRRSAGLRKYYETHEVWNKGLKWPEDVKARIRQACLESQKGMGRKKNTALDLDARILQLS